MVFVTKVSLKVAIWQHTLLQFTKVQNHSNVTFVTKFFCKEQFKEMLVFMKGKNWESIAQKFMKERSHSNLTFVTTFFLKMAVFKIQILSVHDSNKTFKCEICDYSCSYNGSLSKHFASVHNAKKYKLGYKKQLKQAEK